MGLCYSFLFNGPGFDFQWELLVIGQNKVTQLTVYLQSTNKYLRSFLTLPFLYFTTVKFERGNHFKFVIQITLKQNGLLIEVLLFMEVLLY